MLGLGLGLNRGIVLSSGLLLDTLSGTAVGVWSTIKRVNSYAGKGVRVRRTIDDAEQDLSFDDSNIISGSSKIEDGTTTFSNWYDGSSVFVVKVYDQSGNGNDAVQSTAGSQPLIVNAGLLVTDSDGNTSMEFDGGDDHFICTDTSGLDITSVGVSIYSYYDHDDSLGEGYVFMRNLNSSSTTQYGTRNQGGGSARMYLEGGNYDDSENDSTLKKTVHTYDLANVKLYKDGTLEETTARTTAFTSRPNNLIGARSNANDASAISGPFEGKITEVVIFNSAIEQTDIDKLQTG